MEARIDEIKEKLKGHESNSAVWKRKCGKDTLFGASDKSDVPRDV